MKEAYLTKKISLVKLVDEDEEDLGEKVNLVKEIKSYREKNESLRERITTEKSTLINLDYLSETFTTTREMLDKELDMVLQRIKLAEENRPGILNSSDEEEEVEENVKNFLNTMIKMYIIKMFLNQLV